MIILRENYNIDYHSPCISDWDREGLSNKGKYVVLPYEFNYECDDDYDSFSRFCGSYNVDYYYAIPYDDFFVYVAENPDPLGDVVGNIYAASKDDDEFDALLDNYIKNNFDKVFKAYQDELYEIYYYDAYEEMYKTVDSYQNTRDSYYAIPWGD